MPRVSVIIPTFNCAVYIAKAITSVLSQSYDDYEIIVLDDGSTDGTEEVVSRLSRKLIYHYQPNHGLSNARNCAVSISNGEFIAYLDADDMWLPRKLEYQIGYMDAHPECGLVHSDVLYVDEKDQLIQLDMSQIKRRSVLAQGDCLSDLLTGCLFQVPSVMERRVCFNSISGFDERFKRVEDYLHWIKLQLNGYPFGYINKPLAMYRIRHGSLSKNHSAMNESTLQMFDVLIKENSLLQHLTQSETGALSQRISQLKRGLPFHYRQQGRHDLAREKALSLIYELPGNLYPYVELMKSLVPLSLAVKIKKIYRPNSEFCSSESLDAAVFKTLPEIK